MTEFEYRLIRIDGGVVTMRAGIRRGFLTEANGG